MKRILFIQTAFLGDMVFSTALLQGVKELFVESEITVLASPRGADIVRDHPAVSALVVYDKRGRERGSAALVGLVRRLRDGGYDMVVCPHRSFRSALIARLSGAHRRVGFRSGWGRLAFNEGVPFPRREKRPYRRELRLLQHLSAGAPQEHRPRLFVSEREKGEVRALLSRHGAAENSPRVGFVIGTVWPTKKWPLDNFLQAGRALAAQGVRIVVIGGTSERAEGEPFAAEEGFINLVGATTLRQLPALLASCRVIVAADTGPMHAAQALGVPVVALFGPTDEGQFEFGSGDVCLTADLNCRPCSPHGGIRCPTGDWRCMPGIPSRQVEEAVMGILRKGQE